MKKARGKLVLQGGEVIKVTNTYHELLMLAVQQHKVGSVLQYERVTDHGTIKQTAIPIGMITRIEEP